MANDYKAEDLINLIRAKYPQNRPSGFQSHVVLEQVPDGTGMYQRRWIDVVVFSLWSSRGLTRHAFEVKVSRSDFIHELQNPIKHQWVLECFHEFWFVAPQDVIQIAELPLNIGWMCPRGGKLTIKKHAVRNPNPKLDDVLLAGFMRSASKEIDKALNITTKNVLVTSNEHQLAKLFQDATTAFLQSRNELGYYSSPESKEQIVTWLDNATMDKQLQQDRDRMLVVIGRFQEDILQLLHFYLLLANKSLLARDELGKYLVSTYGGNDESSLEALKELAKQPKAFDSQKLHAKLLELITNWGKE